MRTGERTAPFVPPAVRRGEAGYNLVMLAVAITVLSILVAAALPLWSQVIRRDKERELISRGLQYAEAIRVYKARFGDQGPTRLEELVEVEPRCLRKLWKDPMTESGRWVLVFEGEDPGRVPPPPDGRDQKEDEEDGEDEDPFDDEEDRGDTLDPSAPPRAGEEVAVGPIAGVRSRSTEDSVMTFLGQTRYDRWLFRHDVFQHAQRTAGLSNTNVAAFFNPNWWRPFRGQASGGLDQLPPPTGTLPNPRTPGGPKPPPPPEPD